MSETNGKIPDTTEINLGLPGDQMFQRWLLSRVHQRHEMAFERQPPLPTLVGFLTGMDDTNYSISTTGEFPPRSYLIPRTTVIGIVETGTSLHELPERTQVLIKRYTERLHRSCAELLIPTLRMPRPSERTTQQSV